MDLSPLKKFKKYINSYIIGHISIGYANKIPQILALTPYLGKGGGRRRGGRREEGGKVG